MSFSLPLSVSYHQCSTPIHSPTTHTTYCSSPSTSVFPCQYHSTNAPYPLIHLPSTLYVSLPALQVSPVSTIPPMLHTHSFTYHTHYIMFLSQHFSFPLSVPFHQCSIPIHSPTTHTIQCFSPSTSVFPCQYHFTNAPYPFIHLPPTLYNVSLPVLQFSPVSSIPPMLPTHIKILLIRRKWGADSGLSEKATLFRSVAEYHHLPSHPLCERFHALQPPRFYQRTLRLYGFKAVLWLEVSNLFERWAYKICVFISVKKLANFGNVVGPCNRNLGEFSEDFKLVSQRK